MKLTPGEYFWYKALIKCNFEIDIVLWRKVVIVIFMNK